MTPLIAKAQGSWQERLVHAVQQEPTIVTGPSLHGISGMEAAPPRAIFIGFGMCSEERLSPALPFDALTMLLAGERLRRAVGAPRLVVMLADAHCALNGFSELEVARHAAERYRLLQRIGRRAGLHALHVLRASSFHGLPEYHQRLDGVLEAARARSADYFHLEAADTAHVQAQYGRVLKLGWSLGAKNTASTRDERSFDRRIARWLDLPPSGYAYCAPGRTLDPTAPKAPPYITTDPERRLCLAAGERVRSKLDRARRRGVSDVTIKGVRRMLRHAARLYVSLVGPLRGPAETRAQTIVDHLTSARIAYRSRDRTPMGRVGA